MTVLEALRVTAESIRDWASKKIAHYSRPINKTIGITQLVSADFVNGTIEQGSIVQSDYWIVNQEPILVKKGGNIKIEIKEGHKIWWRLVNNKDLSIATNVYNGGIAQENIDYISESNGWLVVQIGKVNSQKIIPTECKCSITVDNNRIDNLEMTVSKLNGFTELSAVNFTNHKLLNSENNELAITPSDYWIMTTTPIEVKKNGHIAIKHQEGVKIWWRHIDNTDIINAVSINHGVASTEDIDYIAPCDGWLVIQIGKITGQTIRPEEYNFTIIVDNRRIEMLESEVGLKQDTLIDGQNIKTINGESILGSGNITIDGDEDSTSSGTLFSKHTPFTRIIDDCQDAINWTINNQNGLDPIAVEDHIIGSQKSTEDIEDSKIAKLYSLHCNNNMLFKNMDTCDLTDAYIVIKVRVNSIGDNTQLILRLGNEVTTGKAYYEIGRKSNWTTPEGWQEIIISSNNYSYCSSTPMDFSKVNEIYIYASPMQQGITPSADWNLQYVGTRPKATNRGIVTFTFDDGWDSQYTGVKLLAEKGITSTIFTIKEAVESGNYLTLDNLKSLVTLYNTDIEVHGDPAYIYAKDEAIYQNVVNAWKNSNPSKEYPFWTDDSLKSHWSNSQKWIKENGLGEGNHLAYPNGVFPEHVVELAKDYFDSCRTIIPFMPVETLPVADRYRIRAVSSVGEGVKVDTIKQYIDRVSKDGGWLVLVLHKIGDALGDTMYCSEEDLSAIADYAIDSGVDIMNYAEVMERFYADLSPEKDAAVSGEDIVIPENVETTDNKVTEINETSTDEQYPTVQAVYDFINQYKHIDILEGEHYVYNLNDGIYAVGIGYESLESNGVVYYDDQCYQCLSDGIIIVSSLLNKDLGDDTQDNEVTWMSIGLNSDLYAYKVTSGFTHRDDNGDYIANIDEYQEIRNKIYTIDEALGDGNRTYYPSVKAVIDFVNDKLALTSNAIKSFKSGTILALDDVSPIEHNIIIKLNDSIPEDKDVLVLPYGKNILQVQAIYTGITSGSESRVSTNADGSITIHKAKGFNEVIDIKCTVVDTKLVPGIYTLSDGLKDDALRGKIFLKLFNSNLEFNTRDKGFDTKTVEISTNPQDYSFECRLICSNPDDEFDCVLYPQLEYGSVATEFEQYTREEILSLSSENTEGIIKSIYPFTTIMCRSESNTTITCEYNRDANKIESGSNIDILTTVIPTEEHTNEQLYSAKALDEVLVNFEETLAEKQDSLVSGENIKTINGVSLLGSGNIVIEGVETDGESSEVSNLRGELTKVLGEVTYNEDITSAVTEKPITKGWYYRDTGALTSNTNSQASNIFSVKQGEKYYITGCYGYYASLIVAFDENNTYLPDKSVFSTESKNFSVDDYEYIVPEGVAYIGCSTRQTIAVSSTTGRDLIVKKEIVEYNNILNIIEETKNNLEEKHNEDLIQLDEKLTLTVKNICPNSDFDGVPATGEEKLNWKANTADSTLKFENNTAIFTANGSTNRSRMKMDIGSEFFKEHIYYIQASIKSSPKTDHEGLTFYTSNDNVLNTAMDIVKEKARLKNSTGLFNDYYGNFDFSDPNFSTEGIQLWVTSFYSLSTDALNQSTQVKNFFICDLTESFGAGKEPSASEFYNILKAGESWFKDSKQIFMVDLIKPTLPIVSDYLITVGENGDCQTINEAIERASKVYPAYKKRGIKVEIRILDGTVIDEQILVEALDLSYISITTDNPDNKVIVTPTATNWDKNSVSHDSRGNMPFFAGEHGARLPVIKCLFSCTSPMLQIEDKTIGIVGYYCNRGSMGVMAVGAAYPENTTQSGAGEIEAEVGFEGFYDCVIANNNSEITLRECIARNAGRYGIMSRHISRISARSADLTNCGTIINEKVKNNETLTATEKETTSAAYADRSSIMDVRFANVSGSFNGIQSFNTSNATAVETIANNITNIVADARAGSIINCDSMTIDNVKDVFKVTKGGSIVATGAKLSNVAGTTYNVTTDIYTSNGTIYVTANKESVSSGASSGGSGVSEAQKQTLLAVINAIGLFNVPNAQTLLDNFNKAWDTVDPVPATSITLDKTEITFTTEETQTIVASVLPVNTTDVVAWTSSNTSIATVKGGVVTPLNDGEAVITAIAGNVSATCVVTVNMFGEIENPVFVLSGVVDTNSTATSEPITNSNYPNSVTFSAIPVKSGTILTCNTNIFKPQDWVWFYDFDIDGLNGKRVWFTDSTAGTLRATRDGFIRVVIMRDSSKQFTTDVVSELSTTTNGEKTTYTLVDRR